MAEWVRCEIVRDVWLHGEHYPAGAVLVMSKPDARTYKDFVRVDGEVTIAAGGPADYVTRTMEA